MTARACFFASGALFLLVLAWMWLVRPDGEIPLHYGFSGVPDRWGTADRAIAEWAAIGVGNFLFLWALSAWTPRLPWEMINLPRKDRWEPHQAWVRRRAQDDLYWTGVWLMLLLTGIGVLTWVGAEEPDPSFVPALAWSGVMLLVLLVGLYLRIRPLLGSPGDLPPGTLEDG